MNFPDHFSESLETVFWVKTQYLLKFFDANPESFMPCIRVEKIRILYPGKTSRISAITAIQTGKHQITREPEVGLPTALTVNDSLHHLSE